MHSLQIFTSSKLFLLFFLSATKIGYSFVHSSTSHIQNGRNHSFHRSSLWYSRDASIHARWFPSFSFPNCRTWNNKGGNGSTISQLVIHSPSSHWQLAKWVSFKKFQGLHETAWTLERVLYSETRGFSFNLFLYIFLFFWDDRDNWIIYFSGRVVGVRLCDIEERGHPHSIEGLELLSENLRKIYRLVDLLNEDVSE